MSSGIIHAACGLFLGFSPGLKAAVVVQTFSIPLAPNSSQFSGHRGPGYIIDGIRYSFYWLAAPADIDLDGDGATDITFGGSGHFEPVVYMYASQTGANQVWSRAGGAGGLDFGSHAMALIGGTHLGPGLASQDPQVGWHNDTDTRATSLLTGTDPSDNPIDGDFFTYSFSVEKYLGVRFERAGAIHYGWIAISNYISPGKQFYINRWAYESEPGKGLIVGQVPEASAISLVMAGLAFLVFCRRRWNISTR